MDAVALKSGARINKPGSILDFSELHRLHDFLRGEGAIDVLFIRKNQKGDFL